MKKLTTLLLILTVAIATSCGTRASSSAVLPSSTPKEAVSKAFGTLLLSVNPEIEITYDEKGIVLSLKGKNADGEKLLAEYTNYQGKNCETVIDELVKKIYADGYFDNKIDGHEKNIVIKLQDGSSYPDDTFAKSLEKKLHDTINECNLTAAPVIVDKKALNKNGLITLEKAKEIILTQLGLSNANFTKADYDPEDNTYEMEFTANGIEYEFEVNADNGKVLELEADIPDKDTPDNMDEPDDSDDDLEDDESDDVDDDIDDDDDNDEFDDDMDDDD